MMAVEHHLREQKHEELRNTMHDGCGTPPNGTEAQGTQEQHAVLLYYIL